jgi:hypothetical protein
VLELSQTRWSSKPSSTLKPQKLDGPVWETGLSGFEVTVSWSLPLSWPMSLFLEHCSALLWPPLDFFLIVLYFIIGQRFIIWPCPLLTTSQVINKRLIGCPLPLLATKCCPYLLGKWMVWFGILDCPIFVPRSFPVLLMADVYVVAISCVVASRAKTLSRSS